MGAYQVAQLFFRYGAMNSGKTIEILKVAHNYEEQNKSVIIMTSGIDDRDSVGYVSSRIGMKRKAVPVFDEDDLYEKVVSINPDASCVLVDEAQFLSKHHILELTKVVDELKIPVMTFGLKNDFRNELFEGSKYLLLYADKIEEMKAICKCGNKATFNLRLNKINEEYIPVFEGEQIAIDGIDSEYDSVCRRCYKKLRKEYGKKEDK